MRPGEKQGVQEDRLLYQRRAVQKDFKERVQEMTFDEFKQIVRDGMSCGENESLQSLAV